MKCLCATTRRTARLLTSLYEDHLRPANVTPAQFELLCVLAEHPDTPQARLASTLALDQTTLSRNLKLLLAHRWVSRSPAMEDKRQVRYRMTPAGTEVWRTALPLWRAAQEHIQTRLGPNAQSAFTLMDRLALAAAPGSL